MSSDLIRPIVTVDVVLLTLHEGRIHVLLQEREKPPHRGQLALVGGYVHPEEDQSTAAAAVRVLKEKTGLAVRLLEQLMTFSGPDRDLRGWSISVSYYALLSSDELESQSRDSLKKLLLKEAKGFPFDHDAIVAEAAARCRRRAGYSSLPAFLLRPVFTLSALRQAYEASLGRTLNDSAFRRKIDELRMIEPVLGSTSKASARPAQLYRLSRDHVVDFDRTF